MLRHIWALFAAVTVVAGLVLGNVGVVALGLLVAAAGWGATLWARISLRRLTYDRIIPEDHAFPGEAIEVRLRVTNSKALPLPWLEVRERFAAELTPGDDSLSAPSGEAGVTYADWRTSLAAHQRISKSYEFTCGERGVYDIGPSSIRSGDPFGLFTDERMEERRSHIVVYPRTMDLGDLRLPARRPYGDERGGMWLFDDPSRIAGLRDYLPGDGLRRVDWNATARLGRLQSRVYEPAASKHMLVCLNTQTIVPMWAGVISDVLERSISVAASVARDAYDTRYAVGLLANCTFPEADRPIRILPGRRPEQFIRILESLALVTPFVLEPLSAMLDREEHRLAHGTTIAVVTGIMTDDLAVTLNRMARRGHSVVVLKTTSDTWTDDLRGIELRDCSGADATRAAYQRPTEEARR